MTPAAPLTDHELSMLERAQTELEWNQAVILIGEARNHEMPSDWVERVHTSGLEQRSKQKFLLQRQDEADRLKAARDGRPSPTAGFECKIVPRNNRLEVRLEAAAQAKSAGGLFLSAPDAEHDRHKLVQALVIATAPEIKPADVKPGDIILVHHNLGWDIRHSDGASTRLIEYSAVQAVLERIQPPAPPALTGSGTDGSGTAAPVEPSKGDPTDIGAAGNPS